MKAIQILECLCYMGKDSEQFAIVEINENSYEARQEFCQNFFGGKPHNIVNGKYFYYWTDETLGVLENGKEIFSPDSYILTGEYDSDGIPMAINFYRIED